VLVSSIQQEKANASIAYYEDQLTAQKVFSEGVQKSLSNITQENDYLKEQINKEKGNAVLLKAQIAQKEGEIGQYLLKMENQEKLIKAYGLYLQRKYKDTKALLETIDLNYLTDEEIQQKDALYQKVKKA
jgi:hypothetical protein